MANETRELARFAATLGIDDIPPHVRELAIDLLVDQIGCEIGGSELPWAQQVRSVCMDTGGKAEASVIRYGDKLPAAAAAFVNSTFGHSFEFDDANPFFQGHPGAELVPALMTVGESRRATGKNFLSAFIAGYETRGRIGWAVTPNMSEHGGPQFSTACGVFGVAAAVGRLMQLEPTNIEQAMAIAGSYSGGLMQYDHGGGSVKRIHTAIAASNGIQAVRLQQAGMSGPTEILEGARGFLRIYCSAYRPERLVAEFGTKWTIEHALFKPYCCGALIHPAIDAVKKIFSDHNLNAQQVEFVDVGYTKRCYDHCAIAVPHDVLGMQFSTAYSLALTMLKGHNSPQEYTEHMLRDPEVKMLASRVRLHENEDLTRLYEGKLPARVKLTAKDGRVFEELVIASKGSRDAPLSSSEIDDKFRLQASDALGSQACDELISALRGIESLDNVAEIPRMYAARGQRRT